MGQLERPRRLVGARGWTAALALLLGAGAAQAQVIASPGGGMLVPAVGTFWVNGIEFYAVPCASEYVTGSSARPTAAQTCTFNGSRRVLFGAGGKWQMANVSGKSVTCSAAVLGGDPIPSQTKKCYLNVVSTPAVTVDMQSARLLNQAAWGATATDIAAVSATTPEGWINAQLTLPLTTPSHWDYVATGGPLGTSKYINATMESFWSQAMTGRDQLRQRMVLALSEIFVVSTINSAVDTQPDAHASYLDMLARNAFGNYRQLLEDVSRHPTMGRYLSHLGNQKEDPLTGRLPDENYAREVMQLFSIGLWELNPDGSRQLDASSKPIPTYGQAEVMGMAKVFTGWGWGGLGGFSWDVPMRNYPEITSTSEKRIVRGVVIPAGTDGPASLKIALDTLANHPNVGPFLGSQLIKRFVTSNPSPAYVARISKVWADNGQGVRGDLGAVIKAILLDPEARSDLQLVKPTYGKLREPMLRFGHWLRAFNAKPTNGVWNIWNLEDPVSSIGQNPLRAPSVFNWFRPDYAPPGPILAAGLVAPEFQITHETTLTGYANSMSWNIERGASWSAIMPDYGPYEALADRPDVLLERLSVELMAGQMSSATRQTIRTAIAAIPMTRTDARFLRTWQAIYLVMTSPEYVVQR